MQTVFLAFSFDDQETMERFMSKHDFHYTQFPNSKHLIAKLSVGTYPTHMVLDKTGIIRKIEVGAYLDIDEKLHATIEDLRK